MRKKSILLLVLVFISLSLIPFTLIGSAQDDISYTFNTDVLYAEDDPDFDATTNKLSNAKNVSTYTDIYNATFSFTDDIDGSIPNGWNLFAGSVIVLGERLGHGKVLRGYHDGVIAPRSYSNFQASHNSGSIEFWLNSDDVSKHQSLYLMEGTGAGIPGGSILMESRFNAGEIEIRYGDGVGGVEVAGISAINGVWYHLRIEFDCTTDTIDAWINNIMIVNNKPFYLDNDLDFAERVVQTNWAGVSNFYIDALGYSWDTTYYIGLDFVPYREIDTSIKEVDRWEFAYSSFEVRYAIGSDVFSDWDEIDTEDDLVNIKANADVSADRLIGITHFALVGEALGVEREFNENGNIFNITWGFELINDGNPFDEYEMKVYSSDDTLISDIYFEDVNLKYNFGGANILWSSYTENEYYQLNLYINYNDELSVLIFYIDGVYEDTFYIPLIASGKEGLGKIENQVVSGIVNDHFLDIDYIGVYNNDTSISTEFGHLRIDDVVPLSTLWRFNDYNLVNFDMIGNSSIWISESHPYLIGLSIITEIAPNGVYSESDTVNVYDTPDFGGFPSVEDPIIWFQFWGQFQFSEIEIEGVRLNEGGDIHILEFTYGNVDINESYFYVDSANRLQFLHNSDDTDLEFIQARFNVNDVSSDDSAISFKSKINSNALGFFRVNFTSVSNVIQLPIIEMTSRVLLTQNLTIRDYIVLITDNDVDLVSGLTSGYVSEVSLLVVSNIEVSIITSALINIIIPLAIIIVPTFGLSAKVGRNAIVPIFILMSLLLVVTSVIPVWLFFIIAVSSALFIFVRRDEGMF